MAPVTSDTKVCRSHDAERHDYYSTEAERERELEQEEERQRELERARTAELRRLREEADRIAAGTPATATALASQAWHLDRPRNGRYMQRRNAISGPSSGPSGPR
ncbi:hypothetical protein PV08_03778 [Exophiala spinifera]|uniref:Uncharacterized protein n=1 Tax=Exophiala spinifera TaxID=91928 RepID=A0A0D2BDB7_9EURO|nr:uncharacterized protein PV08_03778 [Exophiala spinifera]KIW16590.1 hypothetical protein PV08_03778 [Exophiala spinifera]